MEQKRENEKRKPMPSTREVIGFVCFLLALGLFLTAATAVLLPKRHEYGAVWGMYEKEPKNSADVMFFGTSLAYCDIVPAILYEQSGVTSFVMAGPLQPFSVTYGYLREACKTQSPQTVFIEVTGLALARDENSVKANLTFMPRSADWLRLVFEETEGDDRAGLLFPLYAYHDRWSSLNVRDWREGLLGYDPDPLAGYMFLSDTEPVEGFSVRENTTDEHYESDIAWLEKMLGFCREEGIRPVFFISPAPQRLSDDWLERLKADFAAAGAELVDFNDDFDAMGFDLSADFYDPRHLNFRGAEKFSRYLAERLSAWDVSPSGDEDATLWQERIDYFHALAARQEGAK